MDRPLFTICFLLSFQVRKFISLFEMLKQEKHVDKQMLESINKTILKFGKYFQTNVKQL